MSSFSFVPAPPPDADSLTFADMQATPGVYGSGSDHPSFVSIGGAIFDVVNTDSPRWFASEINPANRYRRLNGVGMLTV